MASGLPDWGVCVSEVKGRLEEEVGLEGKEAGSPRGEKRDAY